MKDNELLPQELVFADKGEVFTDSYKIAKGFNMRHADVLRAIRSLECSDDFASTHFCAHVVNAKVGAVFKGREYYQITHDGAMFLIMGFTGKKAALIKERFIVAFREMANRLSDYSEYQELLRIEDIESQTASEHGRGLNRWGKIKKIIEERKFVLEKRMQPDLFKIQ